MEGGIRAWNGVVAEGLPEAGIAYFKAGTSAADMVSLAWALEESTRQFYAHLAETRPGSEESDLFRALVQAEEHHKETLSGISHRLTTEPVSRMSDGKERRIMEGGMDLDSAQEWVAGKPLADILDLAIGMEANAYDRYLKMMDASAQADSREVFRTIAGEEKKHLARLADLRENQAQR